MTRGVSDTNLLANYSDSTQGILEIDSINSSRAQARAT
ncbi:hypothetical protein CCACVL1_13919 [Corchorus capsularis]|uniref:Uncharacterized protein n=1 Tax=Corchorus capsularis TaxID=210143 RepID=A0A1R3I929_COCAP|nr:hypothetical protein CCACVL1_13919 [Corchorus capsularis]